MDTQKLRQRILDLAIRGKLVPQDPNDEPASVLLDRIRAEKERLIAEGKIKRPKAKKSTDKSHYQQFSPPFDIPKSWQWVRLDDIAYVASGSTPSKESFVPYGIPYLKMYNLRKQKIDFQSQPQYISEEVHNGKLSRSRATAGDIIMNIVGPPLGKLAIIPTTIKECNFNQAAVMIRPFYLKDILAEYLFNYLEEMSEINCISTKGTAGQVNISLTQAQNMRISLPPVGEMIRINEKIRQYRSVFETLDTNSNELTDSIAKAKSKILDLAMQGMLVPQDPADEPAADMLRRINPKAKIITDTPHYPQLPYNWITSIFSDICVSRLGKTLNSETDTGDLVEYLCAVNVKNGYFDLNTLKQARIEAEDFERYSVYKGDLLICEGGDVGRCAIWDGNRIFYQNALHRVRPLEGIDLNFLFYFMQYAKINNWIEDLCSGVTIKHFTTKSMAQLIIGLPPTNEQKRIVAKIKELFITLNKIEASIIN